jgi:TatD DNase family protein
MPDITYKYKNNLYLNITNQCPNDCQFCNIERIGRDLGIELVLDHEPDYNELVEALENNIAPAIDELVFCGGGEPLMRLDIILRITDYIKSNYSHRVRLDTCGFASTFYQDRDVIQELIDAGLDSVSISVNSTNPEDYKRICQPNIPDAFQKTIDFVKACKKSGLNTRISFVNYKIDQAECARLAEDLNVDYIIRGYVH